MRILFHNSNRALGFGGIEHWMIDVAEGLRARGHSSVLYGRRGAGWLREGTSRGLQAVRGAFGVDLDPRAVLRLASSLRRHQIDVIFVKGKKGARTAAIASRVAGRGRVVIVFGIEGELSERWVDRWTWRWAVDRGVVLAEEAKRWYEQLPWVADGRLRVLFKGVDVDLLDPNRLDPLTIRAELGIPNSGLVVGTVGRLVWQKGHTQLLRAAAAVRDVLPDTHFLVVGSGEERARLETEARALGIRKRVTFTGYRRDVAALLGAMDIFVLPSRKENMPQVLLEAMAMGRPVVSTSTIGVREVLTDGESGFVVPTNDSATLAERIIQLAQDPSLRETMGARGRERILGNFTREHMLARVERLLHDVCPLGNEHEHADSRRAVAG